MLAPFLSVVVPNRNVSYANVPAAQNKCLAILRHQLEDYRIESEIVVVEYNPQPRAGEPRSDPAG
jgi:hypothetical protein